MRDSMISPSVFGHVLLEYPCVSCWEPTTSNANPARQKTIGKSLFIHSGCCFEPLEGADIFLHNDERVYLYQRRRASITGLSLWSGKIIETERLVVVVMTRLVGLLFFVLRLDFDCHDGAPTKPLTVSEDSPHGILQIGWR